MVSETLILDAPLKTRPDWKTSDTPVPYPEALAEMEARAAGIADGTAGELVWLLEHPPIYTAGTSAQPSDLLDARFPVYQTGRGGQFTYHGPGQRVGYAMLDLKRRKPDVRAYVHDLEQWLIEALAEFNVKGERREGRVGIWVQRGLREDKIDALGECQSGPDAFLRHRAVRRARAWRDQPRRSGDCRHHGRCGRGAEKEL
jgi:lipoyl(octanoyl) transferase